MIERQELAQAIWDKTLKEVSQGTMGPPMTWEEVEKYQDDFQVTPSFGLEQGDRLCWSYASLCFPVWL